MSTTEMQGLRHRHQSFDKSWSTLSVRDFFEQLPWTGAPASTPEGASDSSATNGVGATHLTLTLKVGEYFNRFPWDGQPDIAVPIAPVNIQPDSSIEEEITLEGFADLF